VDETGDGPVCVLTYSHDLSELLQVNRAGDTGRFWIRILSHLLTVLGEAFHEIDHGRLILNVCLLIIIII
jgi:hypothetical protein